MVLVMTTNAGAEETSRGAPSASPSRTTPPTAWRPSSATSRPEFRNRLDAVVQFGSLGPETIASVVDKFIFELEQQLAGQEGGAQRWTPMPAPGSPRRAMTRRWVPARWPG